MAICLIFGNTASAQGLLKKVSKSMTDELLGKSQKAPKNKNADQPEPKCACDAAEVVMDMGGKLQLDYKELTISVLDDGSVLIKSRGTNDYYIIKDGVTQGPIKSGDPRIAAFEAVDDNNADKGDQWLLKYKEYITKPDGKYMISFGGKSYGPYGQINSFVVTKSKDKFTAMVVENTLVNEDDSKKMEEAMKNAKTDQEKMDLSMQYAQEMQQKMMQGGGPTSILPKLVTNMPDVTYDQVKTPGATFNGTMKYDDILLVTYNKIMDIQGNVLFNLNNQEALGNKDFFVNTANTKYAYYNFGTLTFSDKTTFSELFNPRLIKVNGQVYLAYMYYSPKKNAIMQCKILF